MVKTRKQPNSSYDKPTITKAKGRVFLELSFFFAKRMLLSPTTTFYRKTNPLF